MEIKKPLLIAATFAVGMFFGTRLQKNLTIPTSSKELNINEISDLIKKYYVDSIATDSIVAQLEQRKLQINDSLQLSIISKLLSHLDPHSIYLPPNLLQQSNEDMKGEFAGVGIEYSQYKDTITVNYVIPAGPAQKAGLVEGDKLLKVNDSIISGIKINSQRLRKLLRGEVNSTATILYNRNGKNFTTKITRGLIALPSIDANYMVNANDGYIKLSKFSLNSHYEMVEAIKELQQKGMKNLILDLRENGGGSLQDAVEIVDEFVPGKELVTFTQGVKQNKQEYYTKIEGVMENGKLAILIDENSASASEVVAGALQDLGRATIIGRRSFGKGLVQRQFGLSNNAAVRLTVARYYTPSGRCIQKSYSNGKEAYANDVENRLKDKSLFVADSNKLDKSKIFKTKTGKIVYGGGGIMPDIFIALDTSTTYFTAYNALIEKGILQQFANTYIEQHKNLFLKEATIHIFSKGFTFSKTDWQLFTNICITEKINLNNLQYNQKKWIENRIKQLIARLKWRNNGYYQTLNENDNVILKAIEQLN